MLVVVRSVSYTFPPTCRSRHRRGPRGPDSGLRAAAALQSLPWGGVRAVSAAERLPRPGRVDLRAADVPAGGTPLWRVPVPGELEGGRFELDDGLPAVRPAFRAGSA